MAKPKKKKKQVLNPMEISADLPLVELVQLEVSLLKLVQTLHETGISAVHYRMCEMAPEDAPDLLLESAVELYNNVVEKQQKLIQSYFEEEMEDEDQFEGSEEDDLEEIDQIILDSDKGPNSPTLH